MKPAFITAIAILLLSFLPLQAQPSSPSAEIFEAVKSCNLQKVKSLSDQDPRLLSATEYGAPLLHLAAYCKDTAVAEVLIDNKADVNAVDSQNRTALILAAMMRNLALVKLLVAKHA